MDRSIQLQMLESLQKVFPEHESTQSGWLEITPETRVRNLAYLEQHGLVDVMWSQAISGPPIAVRSAITAKGIDFLADDGGLSAILGVITIKLHDDTVHDLLIARVNAAIAPATEKSKLIEQIKSLRGEALKTVTTEGLKYGLAHAPDAISWLHTILSRLA